MSEAWKKYVPMNQPVTDTTRQDLRSVFDKWDTQALADRIAAELGALRDLFGKNLEGRIKEIERTVEGQLARQHAVGLLYSKTGLYGEAGRTFARALFGTEVLPGADEARRLLAGAGEDTGDEGGVHGIEIDGEAAAVLLSNLATCLTLSAGSAGDLARARLFFESGERAYQEGAYEAAIAAFQQAQEVAPHPAIFFSLAQAYRLQYFLDGLGRPSHGGTG